MEEAALQRGRITIYISGCQPSLHLRAGVPKLFRPRTPFYIPTGFTHPQSPTLFLFFLLREELLTGGGGCVGAYHGRAMRVMGAAALGLAQKSETATFVDIETL